jgi:exosortase/archaeosortase family protein
VILPVLALLLLASSVSAQDMPDLVLIDVDLHWTVPTRAGGVLDVRLFGSELWQNGVGYADPGPHDASALGRHFHVTGLEAERIGAWFNFPGETPSNAGKYVLELESNDSPTGIRIFRVPFNANDYGPANALLPGDYDITRARFENMTNSQAISVDGIYFAESGHQSVTAVPELAILRSFTKRIGGQQFNALVNPTLQRVTAWGAAKLLQAPHDGDRIFLTSATLEVQQWCSGVASMKWLMVLALVLGLVCRISLPWIAALIVVAAMISLETNVLRVASVGAGIELFGHASREAIKEWTGWGATVFGVAQVVGLGLAWPRPERSLEAGLGGYALT